MAAKIAVVAVATNLVGRIVAPKYDPAVSGAWPSTTFGLNLSGERLAEVVAVFVGDLTEGGSLKLMVKCVVTGDLAEVYANHVRLNPERV